MEYYSPKRILYSILMSVVTFTIVVSIFYESAYKPNIGKMLLTGVFAVAVTLMILLPKIWWNFLLNRIREISKAIKDTD